jgi:hypothetical protein
MVRVNDFTFLDCLERLSKEISERESQRRALKLA